jgi:hypothetical protein
MSLFVVVIVVGVVNENDDDGRDYYDDYDFDAR